MDTNHKKDDQNRHNEPADAACGRKEWDNELCDWVGAVANRAKLWTEWLLPWWGGGEWVGGWVGAVGR